MSDSYTDNIAAQVGIAVFLSILIVIDLIGNAFIILIILTNQSMRSPMNYLLVNLAVADIMVGIFMAPIYIFNHFYTHPGGLTGRLLCSILTGGNVAWVAQISSCLSLVAISIERYFAIMHPFSVKYRLSTKKVKRITITSWICAMIFVIPLFVVRDFDHRHATCTAQWPKNKPWIPKAYSFAWLTFLGVIPITIMFVLYSRVIYTLWFKQNQVQGTQLAMLRSRKKITKMMITVSAVYAVCIIPNITMYVSRTFSNISYKTIYIILSIVLVVCNSAINPFIYTLQSTKFRRHFIGLTCCTCCRNICRNRLGIEAESSEEYCENETGIRLKTFIRSFNQLDIPGK